MLSVGAPTKRGQDHWFSLCIVSVLSVLSVPLWQKNLAANVKLWIPSTFRTGETAVSRNSYSCSDPITRQKTLDTIHRWQVAGSRFPVPAGDNLPTSTIRRRELFFRAGCDPSHWDGGRPN